VRYHKEDYKKKKVPLRASMEVFMSCIPNILNSKHAHPHNTNLHPYIQPSRPKPKLRITRNPIESKIRTEEISGISFHPIPTKVRNEKGKTMSLLFCSEEEKNNESLAKHIRK
jgi:hypothetical protein